MEYLMPNSIKEIWFSRSFLTGALVVAIASGLLFLQGASYYSGYLEAFGIPLSLFPPSFEGAVATGYIISFHALLSLLRVLGIAVLYALGIGAAWDLFALFLSYLRSLSPKRPPEEAEEGEGGGLLQRTLQAISAAVIIGLLYVLSVFATEWARVDGFETGSADRTAMDVRAFPGICEIAYRSPDGSASCSTGYVIQCADGLCLAYAQGRSLVIPVERLDLVSGPQRGIGALTPN
jgi:hypothetical protein